MCLKYAALGYNQSEIAEVMHLSQAHISRTLAAVTKQAQADIKHHIEETLPFEKKTEVLGYWRNTPIIKAYPDITKSYLLFWCDHCKVEHIHGYLNGKDSCWLRMNVVYNDN